MDVLLNSLKNKKTQLKKRYGKRVEKEIPVISNMIKPSQTPPGGTSVNDLLTLLNAIAVRRCMVGKHMPLLWDNIMNKIHEEYLTKKQYYPPSSVMSPPMSPRGFPGRPIRISGSDISFSRSDSVSGHSKKHLTVSDLNKEPEKPGVPFVSKNELRDFCLKLLLPEDEIDIFFNLLNEIGMILMYPNDPALSDFIILDPSFLTNVMSAVVSYKNQWTKQGIIKKKDLSNLLNDVPAVKTELISLLERFEMIYAVPSSEDYIVPSMLPKVPPPGYLEKKEAFDMVEGVHRIYDFGFMLFGFFQRALVRLVSCHPVECEDLWTNGVTLTRGAQHVIVSYDSEVHKLSISVIKKNIVRRPRITDMRKFISDESSPIFIDIIESMDSLIQGFYGTDESRVKRIVPYYSVKGGQPHLFDYKDLVQKTLNGEAIIVGDKTLDIQNIAPDIGLVHKLVLSDVVTTKALGKGGFGTVYKGTYQGIEVAIKELHMAQFEGEIDKFKEFMHEVNLMSQFNSPYLVKLFGTSLKPLGMVMEFCSESSLDVVLASKRELPWELRVKIAYDMAMGLHVLHSSTPPVTHRDLRSPNIFLSSLEMGPGIINAKIGDFGLAQYTLPQLNEMLACWQWLAPEVFDARSTAYNEIADIYSYGIVLWELSSRTIPFSEFQQFITIEQNTLTPQQLSNKELLSGLESNGYVVSLTEGTARKESYKVQQIKTAIVEGNLRPTIPKDTPKFISAIIEQCWQKNKSQRPTLLKIQQELKTRLDNKAFWAHLESELCGDNAPPDEMQFQKKTKELLDLQESTMLSGACPIPIDSPKEVPLLICIHSATLKMPGTSVGLRSKWKTHNYSTGRKNVSNELTFGNLDWKLVRSSIPQQLLLKWSKDSYKELLPQDQLWLFVILGVKLEENQSGMISH